MTTGWRFLLSKRWGGYVALLIVFTIVCVLLAQWQFNRRADARAEIARIDGNYDATPVLLTDALPTLDAYNDEDQKWSTVEITGHYLSDDQVLVRNRPLNGSPGFEVLVPFQLANGNVFVIDRGWLPTGSSNGAEKNAPDVVPEAPTGTVEVIARLKAGEPTLPGRRSVDGQIATIHLPDMATRIGLPTYTEAYGLLVSENPAPKTAPTLAPKPERDEGPHLSYALQWYVFAVMGFIGLGYGARQEYRQVNVSDLREQERARIRDDKKSRRRKSDADIEDALLDSSQTH
ncbi:SURF1 family protein [Klugiella xanthotipulae]|uniref:SURF1-like protein n=1 Tax=Klugiella xanthotipulae TaxID=244735 RepID=A0A543HSQ3_9MICO|nr:SURF1 family protein [Klugiella xanthotipulae]TQM61366.1 cytochrome oxidase assembly protein ShyY1 [Klugiella xanthotipulae]